MTDVTAQIILHYLPFRQITWRTDNLYILPFPTIRRNFRHFRPFSGAVIINRRAEKNR